MFNLRRLRRFLGNVLGIVIPFLVTVLGLALFTEVVTHKDVLAELLPNWQFWLAVALDMLPVIIVMMLTLWLAARFVQAVYKLDNWQQGMGFLLYSRCDLPGFGPWMKIEKGEIAAGGADILKSIGGPGHLVVYNDSAVVLERGGRLTRVDGTGFSEIEPFEKVYDTIDLRPKRWVYTVRAMTKEGISISWDAEIQYQIDDGGLAPTEQSPYPLSEDHVFRAATCKWVFAPGGAEMMDWEGRLIISETEGNLRTILARRHLDQLVGLTDAEAEAARESVQAELEKKLRDVAPNLGARILGVKLGNLKVDDAVTEQWIKAWKARWQRWSAGLLAQGEASYIYLYETVKAEAQIQLIVNITRTLQKLIASRTITPRGVNQIVLMRLFSVLDRAGFAASSRVFFPTQSLEALEGIRRQLASGTTVILTADPASVAVHGQATLVATVRDASGNPAPNGTPVQFSTDLGSVSPALVLTADGRATSGFRAGSRPDLATVVAQSGPVSDTATVMVSRG